MSLGKIILILLAIGAFRLIAGFMRVRKSMLAQRDQILREMENQQRAQNKKPEGDINVINPSNNKQQKDSNGDDFVDYEEVE